MAWIWYYHKMGWTKMEDDTNAAINQVLNQDGPPEEFEFVHTWWKPTKNGQKEMKTNYLLNFRAKEQYNMDQPPEGRNIRRVTAWWNDDFNWEFDWELWRTGTWPEGRNSGAPQAAPPGSGDGRSSGSGDANGKSAVDWSGWSGKPRGRNKESKTKKTEAQDSTGTWDHDPWAQASTGASQQGGDTQVDGASQDGGGAHVDGASQHSQNQVVEKPAPGSQPHPQLGFHLQQAPPPPPRDPPQRVVSFPWPFSKFFC